MTLRARFVLPIAAALAAAALPGAVAAATLQPAQLIGSGTTLETAAAAGDHGTFAFVVRRQDGIEAAVRRGVGAPWQRRVLDSGLKFGDDREPQVVLGGDGTATAVYTAGGRHPQLMLARAPAGQGFGPAHAIAPVTGAARPRLLALTGSRALLLYVARRIVRRGRYLMGSSDESVYALTIDHRGHASRPRDLGIRGAEIAIAPEAGGAVLTYLVGHAVCSQRNGGSCRPREQRLVLVGPDGKLQGAPLTVTRSSGDTQHPPRVFATGGAVVAAWVRHSYDPAHPPAAFTRTFDLSARRLHPTGVARPFPVYGGIGSNTPSVTSTHDGGLVGAGVVPPGEAAFAATASGDSAGPWTNAPERLGSPGGWTTVPRLVTARDGATLGVFARSIVRPGPSAYDVVLARRTGPGTTTQTTLGDTLATNDAGGLAFAQAPEGGLIVTWPDARGGVSVATSN